METGKTLAIAVAALVSTSMLTLPSQAGSRDFIGGVAVGVGGTLLYKHLKKKKKSKAAQKKRHRTNQKRYSSPARSTIATVATSRNDVIDIQSRLNQLGFDAGTPDGIPGKRTRSAVRGFQHSIGSNPTGKLTQSDIGILYQQTGRQAAGLQGAPLHGQQPYQLGQQPVFPASPQTGVYQQNVSAFPLATAPGAQVTGQVPQLGAGTNQQGFAQTGPQVTFPAIAAGGTAATATYGAAQSGTQPAVNGGAFPVASVETQPSQTVATFPSLGVPANNAGASITQLGSVAPAGIPADAIPQTSNTQIASLQQPSDTGSVDQLQKPSIFGVSPGTGLAESKAALSAEGFENCVENGKLLTCEKAGGSINDRVVIARSGTGDEGVVYMMARELSFKKPVRETFIKGRLQEAYPRLINESDMRIASLECKTYLSSQQETLFSVGIENAELTDEALALCPSYYSINLGESDDNTGIDTATIILFDSSALDTGGSLSKQEQELEDNLKF